MLDLCAIWVEHAPTSAIAGVPEIESLPNKF
jgi:hypothetical protein